MWRMRLHVFSCCSSVAAVRHEGVRLRVHISIATPAATAASIAATAATAATELQQVCA
jgi:hypothetical protein